MNTAARIASLLAITLFTAATHAAGIRIEITEPKLGDGMILTVKSSPLHIAGRVVSSEKVVLLMIGTDRVQVKADGSFQHDLALEEGINRVMIMARDEGGATDYKEFHVAVEVGAAVGISTPPKQERKTEPPPADPPADVEPPEEKPVTGTTVTPPVSTTERTRVPATNTNTSTTTEEHRTLSREEILGGDVRKPASASSRSTGTVYALIVGVSRYMYAREQDLRYAHQDAAGLATLLREQACGPVKAENIVLLQNGEARAGTIKATLDDLLSKATENDLFLFYFSGHGMPDARGQLCLLGADAEIDDPHKAWSSSVTQADILTAMGSARCRNKIMLLDACRSGRIAGGASTDGQQELTAGGNVAILSAADAAESSYESDELEGGIFTHFVLKGMRGAADADGNGIIIASELAAYVSTNTAREAERKGHAQHPRFAAAGRGDMRLCGGATAGTATTTTTTTTTTVTPPAQNTTEEEGDERKIPSYTIVEGKKTLDNVLYTNGTNGDRIRFYPVGHEWIGISARIDGEIFACNGRFPGGDMIEFTDNVRANTIIKGTMHLSLMWDQVEVSFSLADGKQVRNRTLYRTNALPQKSLGEGHVFNNTAQGQQLKVHDEPNGWVFLSGNLGRHIVELRGHRLGDVLILDDNEEAWSAAGVAILGDEGSVLNGWLQFKGDGSIERFDLATLPPAADLKLEGARFDDQGSGQTLSFFKVGNGWTLFSGRVGDRSVEGRARVLGDMLEFDDAGSGSGFQPGRMLVHEKGERLMGEFRFPDPDRPSIEAFPVNMYRSN